MKFQATIDKDRKPVVNWDRVWLYCSRWKPGTVLQIEISRRQKKHPIRAYYFAEVIYKLAEHLGYDHGEETELLHRQLKITFFQIKPDEKGIYRNVPHVFSDDSDISSEVRTQFLEWVIRVAAREGVIVEDPKGNK